MTNRCHPDPFFLSSWSLFFVILSEAKDLLKSSTIVWADSSLRSEWQFFFVSLTLNMTNCCHPESFFLSSWFLFSVILNVSEGSHEKQYYCLGRFFTSFRMTIFFCFAYAQHDKSLSSWSLFFVILSVSEGSLEKQYYGLADSSLRSEWQGKPGRFFISFRMTILFSSLRSEWHVFLLLNQ